MAKTIIVVRDRPDKVYRRLRVVFWLDRAKLPLPAPGFKSAVPDIDGSDQQALEDGTVTEAVQDESFPGSTADASIRDALRKHRDELQAWVNAAIDEVDAAKQGSLYGWSE